MSNRPYILTIGGFDPSSGAGITADIKTIEAIQCYGLAICTANTIQTDKNFTACYWTSLAIIEEQLQVILERFDIASVKIGIVENSEVLLRVLQILKDKKPEVKVILDPISSSSTGFEFHGDSGFDFDDILKHIFLVTPNLMELEQLYSDLHPEEKIKRITQHTHLLVKGGHALERGSDYLYTLSGESYLLKGSVGNYSEKHGSGCILASAIASYLALGASLKEACTQGKNYIEKALASNPSLLAYHG